MGYAGGDIMTAPPAIMGSVAPAPPQYIGYAGTEIISAPPVVNALARLSSHCGQAWAGNEGSCYPITDIQGVVL
eukprot:3245232-Amphidinium_carterae.1